MKLQLEIYADISLHKTFPNSFSKNFISKNEGLKLNPTK